MQGDPVPRYYRYVPGCAGGAQYELGHSGGVDDEPLDEPLVEPGHSGGIEASGEVADEAGVKAEEPETALETALVGPPGLLRVVLSVE